MSLNKVGHITAALVLASWLTADAQNQNEGLTLVGPRCQPLVTGFDMITIGEVCTDVVSDEVDITITLSDDLAGCCLKETHICNIPTMFFQEGGPCEAVKFYDIASVADVYNFMCVEPGDSFQVNGHASIICDRPVVDDNDLDGDGLNGEVSTTEFNYGAMYQIDFLCGDETQMMPPTKQPTPEPTPDPTPNPTPAPVEVCTLTCDEGEYVSQDCTCSRDPCDACPEGTICLGKGNEPKTCLDCSCGFCNPAGASCCKNSPPNQCNSAGMDNTMECQLQNGYFPSFAQQGGQSCSGVEISDTATNEGCGCRPSNTNFCNYDSAMTQEDKCFACTAEDILAGGVCSADCRPCILACITKEGCDTVTTTEDMQECVMSASMANGDCLSACNDLCMK